ncbi:MAG: 50S ribosomal protein L19e [Candidatus Aenigmarchaeota archaeon]|nr:50S ribosomal protein L19e [Candidatus Aenigmarchaeota archaeon]
MNLRNKRRMASEILGVGAGRIKIDPMKGSDVAAAITKDDVRKLISGGTIVALPSRGISTARSKVKLAQKKKGRSKGHGRRRGTKNTREPKKAAWIKTIRAIRKFLSEYKEKKKITTSEYRKLYRTADGGSFKSIAYLKQYIGKMKEKTK